MAVEFRILGPLQALRAGEAIEPGSPKQRALLINLLVHHGRVVSRDRLIEDLWAGSPPSTALGVLQNYISQLRRTLGSDVVVTRGPGYLLDVDPETIDTVRFEGLVDRGRAALRVRDPGPASDLASDALALWRGPALVDVADEPFAQAEIGRLEELRAAARELQLEAEISCGRHREAIASLEAAVVDHPFRERLWWLLMLAFYRTGRQADALRAYQRARTALAEELGLEPGTELRELEVAILEHRRDVDGILQAAGPRRTVPRHVPPVASLLGRSQESSAIEAFLSGSDDPDGLLLLVGEPGIGKTRLLEEAASIVEARGGFVVAGRGFEAERGRPYGAWVDALRSAPMPELDRALRAGLAPLLPELTDEAAALDDPNRLYDTVVRLLSGLAARSPVAVIFDDAHWLDEASFALLHFAIRHLPDDGVSFVASARPAELDDNPASIRTVQALRRDGALTEVFVGPLTPATIAELTKPIAPDADADEIARVTHGNPLFALEMARALARSDEPVTSRIDALIGDRLARVDERAGGVLPWVAAFGRGVPPMVLAQLVERDPVQLFESLGDLERHGVLRADGDTIDFVHDLVRNAAYKRLSTPRRTVLHARIGAVLASLADPDDGLAAEAARHADLGGDSATCAAACARAAGRCLRLLAYTEADALVTLGRRHALALPPAERVRAELALIRVLLHPGVRLREPGEVAHDLAELCAEAQGLGLDTELSSGLSLLARAYHWGWGDIPRARALMQRAVQLIESTPEPDLEPLLEGARCLAYLEMDMERTARLFDELQSLHTLAVHSFQFQWGLGLVQAWRGDLPSARAALSHAIDAAAARRDHWATFECTARLALLNLEAGDVAAANSLCCQLEPLADKLGGGSEAHYAAAITSLCRIARNEPGADMDLDVAIQQLERIDARFLVPDLHGIAAELRYRAGDRDRAQGRAAHAARVADEVARPFEAARAHALLACLAAEDGDSERATMHLDAVGSSADNLPAHVEELRQSATRLLTSPTR